MASNLGYAIDYSSSLFFPVLALVSMLTRGEEIDPAHAGVPVEGGWPRPLHLLHGWPRHVPMVSGDSGENSVATGVGPGALVSALRDESHINAIGHTTGTVKRRMGKPL